MQSPKPRLSGYYRPGLKSSLGSGRSRKTSRLSAPISDFSKMASSLSNKSRHDSNVEDIEKSVDNNQEEESDTKRRLGHSVRESHS